MPKDQKEIDQILRKYIGSMFGSLEAASIKYFLETGTINGSFRHNLTRMINETLESAPVSSPSIETEIGPDLGETIDWMRQAAIRNFHNSEGAIDVNYYEGYLNALEELRNEMELSPSIQEYPAVEEKTPVEEVPEESEIPAEIEKWAETYANQQVKAHYANGDVKVYFRIFDACIALYRYLSGRGLIETDRAAELTANILKEYTVKLSEKDSEIASLKAQLEAKIDECANYRMAISGFLYPFESMKSLTIQKGSQMYRDIRDIYEKYPSGPLPKVTSEKK